MDKQQDYKNHTRISMTYHIATGVPLLALVIGSFINLCNSSPDNLYSASLICLMSLIILSIFFHARSFALKAQDRAIRAEESLRYFAMTGNLPDSKLTMKQFIALRFAPNNELLDLAHRAVAENLSPDEIKKAIKHWKSDHDRV